MDKEKLNSFADCNQEEFMFRDQIAGDFNTGVEGFCLLEGKIYREQHEDFWGEL